MNQRAWNVLDRGTREAVQALIDEAVGGGGGGTPLGDLGTLYYKAYAGGDPVLIDPANGYIQLVGLPGTPASFAFAAATAPDASMDGSGATDVEQHEMLLVVLTGVDMPELAGMAAFSNMINAAPAAAPSFKAGINYWFRCYDALGQWSVESLNAELSPPLRGFLAQLGGGVMSTPPADYVFYPGEIVVDNNDDYWICYQSGVAAAAWDSGTDLPSADHFKKLT